MSSGLGRFFALGFWTLGVSLALSLTSRALLSVLGLLPSLLLLLTIILVGVAFDVIGVAATAAEETPLHAMAADKVRGARQAVWLVRHADRVASFSSDLVGDVAGTLSGAVAAILVVRVAASLADGPGAPHPEATLSAVMIGVVAALTVGGKAWGKKLAVDQATAIVASVGWALDFVERAIGVRLLPTGYRKKARRARRRR